MASTADEQNLEALVSAEETDYEQLIDDYSHFAPPHDGELLQGRVVKLHEKDVIVDFGYKSEGLVPIEQFIQPDGNVHIRTGDVIDVSYLDTTLWEFGGQYLSTDHPSGRLIKFPNEKVLDELVYNNSWPLFPYIWNEIKFNIAYQSDLEFVAKTMQEIAEAELGGGNDGTRRSFSRFACENSGR